MKLGSLIMAILMLYGLPLVAAVFFAVCLIRFLVLRKRSRRAPDSVSTRTLRNAKIWLIVSSAVFGAFVAILIALAILVTSAVAYM